MDAYSSYKKTSLPWLPTIPAHWSLIRNKQIFSESTATVGDNKSHYPLLSLTKRGIILRDISSGKGKFPKDFSTYKIVQKGDFAFCLFDIDETPRTVGLSSYIGMLTGAYSIFHVKNINARYVYYYYLALDNVKALRPLYTGLRKTISSTTFLGIKLPVPPLTEQDQIAKFLDWKLSQINQLIVLKKEELNLLNKQRARIINDALTHGIGTMPLKPSAIEGLSAIPYKWEEKPLKWYICRNTETLSDKTPGDYEFDYIDISTVGFNRLKGTPVHMQFADAPSRARKIVKTGDTILSMVRTYLRSICYIDESLDGHIVSTGFAVLRPKENVYPPLLSYALSSDYFINSVIRYSIGTSYPAIAETTLLSLKLALPASLQEQITLFKQIAERTAKVDAAIQTTQAFLSMLNEFKMSLIADVVTGQVDVRDVAIPRYEHVDEAPDENDAEEEG